MAELKITVDPTLAEDLTVDVNCVRANHPVNMTATEWMNRFVAGNEDKNNFTCDSPACLAL